MGSSKKEDTASRLSIGWIALITFVLCFVVVATYVFTFKGGFSPCQDIWGRFGDYVGGTLNPLLAFVAFIALLYTINLQQKELKEQRENAKKQMTATVLLNLRETYGSAEMKSGIQHLLNLKRMNRERFDADKKAFVREYIELVPVTSNAWAFRRCVSHFFQNATTLIAADCLNKDDFFSLHDPPMGELIELLDLIETAISEKYSRIPSKSGTSLSLLRGWLNEWQNNQN